MRTTLDSQNIFDEEGLEITTGVVKRETSEREIAGLDGVISIDLGKRGRQIKQKGVFRAVSKSGLDDKISQVSAFLDGKTHSLVRSDGEEFLDVKLLSFKVGAIKSWGGGVACDYEIIYIQLVV